MTTKTTCENCKFFTTVKRGYGDVFVCRRNPVTVEVQSLDWWCGEYQPK